LLSKHYYFSPLKITRAFLEKWLISGLGQKRYNEAGASYARK
jgi:hypothetical protein